MQKTYEVIVVGAGPAGCILAYELAKAGIKVLVLEKAKLPRYKCCAGGLTAKTVKTLPVDVNLLAEDIVKRIEIQFGEEGYFCGDSPQELIYTVKRDKFDYALARKAEEAGAIILQEQLVSHVENMSSYVAVTTPESIFQSQFLVGADGSRSVVADSAGFNNDVTFITGLNAEIAINNEDNRWKGQIYADIGSIPAGYGWVFPKSDHVAVGIASVGPAAKKLNYYNKKFIDSLGIKEERIIRKSGAVIRLSKGIPQVTANRIALIGDAAGLADPLSGEGIYHAVKSALLAATTIKECLAQGKTNLTDYQHAIDEEIIPEIKIARVLQKLFIHFPQIVTRLLNFDERVWNACCRFACGELTYTIAKQRIGGFKGMREFMRKALS